MVKILKYNYFCLYNASTSFFKKKQQQNFTTHEIKKLTLFLRPRKQ